MCKDNSFIWLALLVLIFFRSDLSTPLSFTNFFELESSAPFFSGTGALL